MHKILKKRYLLPLIVFSSAILLFIPSFNVPFIWDDLGQVVGNRILRQPDALRIILTSSTFDIAGELGGAFYRPIFSLFNLLNFRLWGLYAPGFHLLHILLHAINSVLVYYLIRNILRSFSIEPYRLVAFISALIFSVHPVNVESVSYLAAVGEVIYTLLAIVAMLVVIDRKPKFTNLILSSVLAFIALFVKEAGIVIWPIIFVYLMFNRGYKLKMLLAYIGMGTLSVSLYLYIRLFLVKVPVALNYMTDISEASLVERLMTLPHIIMTYVTNSIFPFHMAVYQNVVVSSIYDYRFYLYIPALFCIFILSIFLASKRTTIEQRALLFFASVPIIAYGPVYNIIGIDMTTTDRWMYLPLIGTIPFILLLLWPAFKKLQSSTKFGSEILILILIAYIAVLSLKNIERQLQWYSPLTLFEHDVALLPDSKELNSEYALALASAGRNYEAISYMKHAVALDPDWSTTAANLGSLYLVMGEEQKGLDQFLNVIVHYRDPFVYTSYANASAILINQRRFDEAQIILDEGIELFPNYNRLKALQALLYLNKGDREKARPIIIDLFKHDAVEVDVAEFLDIIDYDFETEFLRAPGT